MSQALPLSSTDAEDSEAHDQAARQQRGATPDRASAALSAIWARRRDEILQTVDVIDAAVLAGLSGELDDVQRHDARRAAHKLAGSAGTFGFLSATEVARDLERTLGEPQPLTPEQFPRLADLVVALRHELQSAPAAPPVAQIAAPATAADLLVVGADTERMQRLCDEATTRGLTTVVAASPTSARPLMTPIPPRIVLLDPVTESGTDAALAFLAEISADLPVLVLTDPSGDLDRIEVARLGGRGFLPRSLSVHQLVDHVVALRERLRSAETTILAVDDDNSVLDAVRAVLEGSGLSVQTCTDGRLLWEQLDGVQPDLLMLDIEMPGVNGLDLCRAIRNDPRWSTLPVLVLTARNEPDVVATAFEAGADDYIAKPFIGPELVARITNRLERVRLFRALADTDHLTGLASRRRATEVLETFQRLSRRANQPLCLAVLDIDKFKETNSAVGHAGGDAALRGIGRALTAQFRGEDIVARWGGDEFVVGMYGMTSSDGRQRLGELVEQIRGSRMGSDELSCTVTVSAGLAEFPRHGDDLDSLYRAADEALYVAKHAGGDRVHVAGEANTTTVFDVVVVEDDLILGDLLEHALVTRGYRTRRIVDGQDAIELLAGPTQDVTASVIVLDWDLPGVDGLRVLRELSDRGILRRTRVIMLTARASEAEVLETLELGAHDHVVKPFSVPVLMQRVRRALEQHDT